MIQFTKSIQLIQTEEFNPQLVNFTLFDEITIDSDGIQYVKLRFELLQNYQSGNKTYNYN